MKVYVVDCCPYFGTNEGSYIVGVYESLADAIEAGKGHPTSFAREFKLNRKSK